MAVDPQTQTYSEYLKTAEEFLINTANYSQNVVTALIKAIEDNDFDDIQTIKDDLDGTYNDSILIEDDNIQNIFPNEDDRKKFYIQIQYAFKTKIKTFHDYNELINVDITKDISRKDIKNIRHIMNNQAPKLLTTDDDKNYYQLLALGNKKDIPLIQNIADTYARLKLNGFVKNQLEFKNKYKLLKDIKLKKTKQAFQMATSSFHARVLPGAQSNPLTKINDRIQDFYDYGLSAIKFIQNLINSIQAVKTPFQIDFWIIPKDTGNTDCISRTVQNINDSDDDYKSDDDNDDNDHNDDDDDDDNDLKYVNKGIGDVLKHLQDAQILHQTSKIKHKDITGSDRIIRSKYNEFIKKYQDKSKNPNAPQFQRLCMIIDRRKKDKNDNDNCDDDDVDDFYIYLPPSDCNKFDQHHTPLTYINNSKTCMLPKKGYNSPNLIDQRDINSISVADALNGQNFVLSFHVEAQDNIKCYVYFNGNIARFFPEDMLNIWPNYFHKTVDNIKFVNDKPDLMKNLDDIKIRDDRFEEWYKLTTGKNDLHNK